MIEIEKTLEKQRAWQEASTNDEAVISAMALESLSKCADAIAVLSGNLKKIGYVWVSSLRTTVLECAGFPGLFGIPAFERFRYELLEGVPLF